MLEYNTNLVATVVLSDPEGQDWANSKPYNDGEAVSAAVQFWWYHMQVRRALQIGRPLFMTFQGLRMDFSNYLPPKIAQRLLGTVLSDSVSLFAVRYSSAK